MEGELDKHRLWVALSDLFVGTEVDYKNIAAVARHYPIEEVEFALFQRVAPVCISNILAPIPPVWWCFDEAQLVADIDALVLKRARQSVVSKCLCSVKDRVIRLIGSSVWARLRAEVELAKREKLIP